MATTFYPLNGCKKNASERRTAYANSVLHLFKSDWVPTPSSPDSEYAAHTADYTGYAPVTITTWEDPILAPGSGFMIGSPIVQFEVGSTDPAVANLIGGCYLQDAAGATRIVIVFDAAVPMQFANQGLPINLVDVFPSG